MPKAHPAPTQLRRGCAGAAAAEATEEGEPGQAVRATCRSQDCARSGAPAVPKVGGVVVAPAGQSPGSVRGVW